VAFGARQSRSDVASPRGGSKGGAARHS